MLLLPHLLVISASLSTVVLGSPIAPAQAGRWSTAALAATELLLPQQQQVPTSIDSLASGRQTEVEAGSSPSQPSTAMWI